MNAIYGILVVLLLWGWLRYRRSEANQIVLLRVQEDQMIVGNGFMRSHYPKNWVMQKLFGVRFEYLDPLHVTIKVGENGLLSGQNFYKGEPISKGDGFWHVENKENKS